MSALSEEEKDNLILEIRDQVEEKLAVRESKKFAVLYAIVAIVSFIGFGAVTQFIDFYSTAAVERKLDKTIADLASEKIYAQLLIMSSDLEKATSFSDSDRDAVMLLLRKALKYPTIAAEPSFPSLLKKIIDAFVASDSQIHVDEIVENYPQICFTNKNISATLIQHYGRTYIGIVDTSTDRAKAIKQNAEKAAAALDSNNAGGASAVFRSLVRFRELEGAGDKALEAALASYSEFDEQNGTMFHVLFAQLSDVDELGHSPTPELERIATITAQFLAKYKQLIDKIPGAN